MKTRHIITVILVFIVTISVNAQGDENGKVSFRKDRNFGVGLTPVLNIQSNKNDLGSKTSTLNIGVLATGTLNFREKLVGHIGIGYANQSFKSSYSSLSNYKSSRNGILVQTGLFATLFLIELNKKSQIDFAAGLTTVFRLGNEKVDGDGIVGGQKYTYTSFALAPALRGEWFVTPHLSFHSQVGLFFSFLSGDNNGFSQNGINVKIFQVQDLLGSAGFTFYF
ncbi:MAG: hypothetical protein AB8B74_13100 [Crocinitomicaceae bacterium]